MGDAGGQLRAVARSDGEGGERVNQVVYWSRLPDWKTQTLTPNPDTIYLVALINTKDVGPVVLEIPPAEEGSITGTVDDAWQSALEDVGRRGRQGPRRQVLDPAAEL